MRSNQKGFSLIELVIVVAIIMIIAAIAIPNLLGSKVAANEASAVTSLRVINTAQTAYLSVWDNGYAPTLDSLGGPIGCVASTTSACLVDPFLSVAPYTKSGYVFTAAGTLLDANGLDEGFEVNATPSLVQTTGVRAFCSDQSGIIQFVAPGNTAVGTAAGNCAAIVAVPGVSGPIGN